MVDILVTSLFPLKQDKILDIQLLHYREQSSYDSKIEGLNPGNDRETLKQFVSYKTNQNLFSAV